MFTHVKFQNLATAQKLKIHNKVKWLKWLEIYITHILLEL